MATGKKKRTQLPRVTVYAMSRAELVRFSNAIEQAVAVARDLATLFDRLDQATVSLESAASVIDKRDVRRINKELRDAAKARAADGVANGEGESNGE